MPFHGLDHRLWPLEPVVPEMIRIVLNNAYPLVLVKARVSSAASEASASAGLLAAAMRPRTPELARPADHLLRLLGFLEHAVHELLHLLAPVAQGAAVYVGAPCALVAVSGRRKPHDGLQALDVRELRLARLARLRE